MTTTALIDRLAAEALDEIARMGMMARIHLAAMAETHNRSRGQMFRKSSPRRTNRGTVSNVRKHQVADAPRVAGGYLSSNRWGNV